MKETILTKKEKSDLLEKHKCPKCGGYDIMYYYPNIMEADRIEIEVECENCPLYAIIIAKLEKFFDNRV